MSTVLMNLHPGMVEEIIAMFEHMNVDGETMEYVLEKTNMREQMLRQLVMSSSNEDILELLKEKLHVPELRFQISE
jgi:3-oxoacyl-[acyl-carrier-protein] synthase III